MATKKTATPICTTSNESLSVNWIINAIKAEYLKTYNQFFETFYAITNDSMNQIFITSRDDCAFISETVFQVVIPMLARHPELRMCIDTAHARPNIPRLVIYFD